MTAQEIWQHHRVETPDPSPDQMRERLAWLQHRARNATILVYSLAGVFFVLVALRADAGPGTTTSLIEAFRFVMAAAVILGYEHIQQAVRGAMRAREPISIFSARGSTSCIDAYRDVLEDRLDYLRSAARFYIPAYFAGLPILFGLDSQRPVPVLAAYVGLFVAAMVRVVWQMRRDQPFVAGELTRVKDLQEAHGRLRHD
jgi:hypothetical protein